MSKAQKQINSVGIFVRSQSSKQHSFAQQKAAQAKKQATLAQQITHELFLVCIVLHFDYIIC